MSTALSFPSIRSYGQDSGRASDWSRGNITDSLISDVWGQHNISNRITPMVILTGESPLHTLFKRRDCEPGSRTWWSEFRPQARHTLGPTLGADSPTQNDASTPSPIHHLEQSPTLPLRYVSHLKAPTAHAEPIVNFSTTSLLTKRRTEPILASP
jgi:hypothetical protein